MKIKIILFVIFFLISSVNTVLAKTTLYLDKDKAVLTSEQDVLGINSENQGIEPATQKTTVETVDELLSIIPTKNKLTISSIGAQVDKLVIVENEENAQLESENGLIVITSNDSQAETSLPIAVKREDGKIYVSKNDSARVLNLLPSDARKLIEDAPVRLILKENNAQLVYEYTKEENNKLFGLIPLNTKITTTISTQTGEVHSQSSSWIFDFLKKLLA
ncbi:hypothetical protein HYT02_00840 [Candidatus Gottesmanbacteria bacterium]|nr:hypothetical protein [Candidatus Gottesmanbacteria bacterium]